MSFLKSSKLQRQNFAKFYGIPRNYTEFRDTEFCTIPQNFCLFRTAYGM
jgi:hypothetical protein